MNWKLAYSKQGYKDAKEKLEKKRALLATVQVKVTEQIAAIEASKDMTTKEKTKATKKQHDKTAVLEEQVTNLEGGIAGFTSRYKMIGTVCTMAMYFKFSSSYKGFPIASLPFEPWVFVRRMITQRGIDGIDGIGHFPTACSFAFVYMLMNLGVLPVIKKAVLPKDHQAQAGGMMAVAKTPAMKKLLIKTFGVSV
jgi:hypothetical protein